MQKIAVESTHVSTISCNNLSPTAHLNRAFVADDKVSIESLAGEINIPMSHIPPRADSGGRPESRHKQVKDRKEILFRERYNRRPISTASITFLFAAQIARKTATEQEEHTKSSYWRTERRSPATSLPHARRRRATSRRSALMNTSSRDRNTTHFAALRRTHRRRRQHHVSRANKRTQRTITLMK